jgi:aspartate/methionine/tyrosine aminotransferase
MSNSNRYLKFSKRAQDIEPFRVVEVLTRAKELARQGREIIHLSAGEPDFLTAAPILEAGIRALSEGHTGYSEVGGIPELREALSKFYAEDYGIDVAPERILITSGASGALLLICALLLNPGDSMLVTDPGYPCNRHFMRLVEANARLVPVTAQDNFQLTPELVDEYWQGNTVGAMVASPSNPTGTTLNKEQLRAISLMVNKLRGQLIVDEIYQGIGFKNDIPSILELDSNAFVVNSFSKYFGMTGWRLGWLVAPEDAIKEMEKLAQHLFISLSTPAQYAALACFDEKTRIILDRRKEIFRERRDFLIPALSSLGFSVPCPPEGALYIYSDASKFTEDSDFFCMDLLERQGIAVTPGTDFGFIRAKQHVRFAYTADIEQLSYAVDKIEVMVA